MLRPGDIDLSPEEGLDRERDHVDAVAARWADERRDLDTRPFAIVGRIGRAGHLLDTAMEAKLRGWDVLTARCGARGHRIG